PRWRHRTAAPPQPTLPPTSSSTAVPPSVLPVATTSARDAVPSAVTPGHPRARSWRTMAEASDGHDTDDEAVVARRLHLVRLPRDDTARPELFVKTGSGRGSGAKGTQHDGAFYAGSVAGVCAEAMGLRAIRAAVPGFAPRVRSVSGEGAADSHGGDSGKIGGAGGYIILERLELSDRSRRGAAEREERQPQLGRRLAALHAATTVGGARFEFPCDNLIGETPQRN
ncbi:hypothetical protein HK405_004952, partial [Cladochytrium tenue]